MAAASLNDRGASTPNLLNLINYMGLIALYTPWLRLTRRQLSLEPWWYGVYALCDAEASYMIVLAFKYTTITTVMLLDCFSIPCVMVLSYLFLRASYNRWHFTGVLICLSGLVLTVVSATRSKSNAAYERALEGNILALTGAFLYAVCNVMQESIVRRHDKREMLGMIGLFGCLFSLVQMVALELPAICQAAFTPAVLGYMAAYSSLVLVTYSWTATFLESSDAALFNMSLLTSDIYSMVFAVLVEHIELQWMYLLSFAVTAGGLFLYFSQPPATSPKAAAGSGFRDLVTDDDDPVDRGGEEGEETELGRLWFCG
ncbi:unnamed protein product [Chrysoparadoxa australica]